MSWFSDKRFIMLIVCSSFLVFGRLVGDQFTTLDEVDIPDSLRDLCTQVDEARFREDVSSTALREQQGQATS